MSADAAAPIHHVALYIGAGKMINAPDFEEFAGDVVLERSADFAIGASFGSSAGDVVVCSWQISQVRTMS